MLELLRFALEQDAGRAELAELIEHVNELAKWFMLMQAGLFIWLAAVNVQLFIHSHKKN